MHIRVGIDSARHWTRALYDGHLPSLLLQPVQGVARTSREGDRDEPLRQQRLDTLRNGACPTSDQANVANTTKPTVDPRAGAHPYSLGSMRSCRLEGWVGDGAPGSESSSPTDERNVREATHHPEQRHSRANRR